MKGTQMAYQSTDPATGRDRGLFPTLNTQDIEAAISAAHEGFLSWRGLPVEQRSAALARAADILEEEAGTHALLATEEMGKLLSEALKEIKLSASILRYYATEAVRHLAEEQIMHVQGVSAVVRSEPTGVLLGVMPWNFPYYQVIRFAAPNLLIGNGILLKHASNCPRTALAIESVFQRAGVIGGAYTNAFLASSDVASVLADPRITGVSLTGSESAGMSVAEAAGRNLKKCVLELGGSDPFLVLDDHNLDAVVEVAVGARMANAGQACTAAKRFIIIDGVYESFTEKMVERMSRYRAGDPRDPETTLAPLSSAEAVADLTAIVKDAVSKGATLLLGGGPVDGLPCHMQPTVLAGVGEGMRAFREELFGPVAVVYRAPDVEAALELANDSDFGLGANVFTRDPALAERFAVELEAGMVAVNTRNRTMAELPFGGIKRSGIGRELGRFGLEEFVNKKLVRIQTIQS